MGINVSSATKQVYFIKDIREAHIGPALVWSSVLPFYLISGPDFNANMNKLATSFTRSTVPPDTSITVTDISEARDNSVVMWYDTNTKTQYWYCTNDTVYLNKDSSNMFRKCATLTSLDLTMFDTSNAVNMGGMFNGCNKLTSLNISNWNTSNVNNMSWMFNDCVLLTPLTTNFNTSSATNMYAMFSNTAAASLDLSNFDTSNVTTMMYMFNSGTKLTSVNLSSFNTTNVTDMFGMFSGCAVLPTLDLSSIDTSNVTKMGSMFAKCAALKTITYGPNFKHEKASTKKYDANNGTWFMFDTCPANKPKWTGGYWNQSTYVKNP